MRKYIAVLLISLFVVALGCSSQAANEQKSEESVAADASAFLAEHGIRLSRAK